MVKATKERKDCYPLPPLTGEIASSTVHTKSIGDGKILGFQEITDVVERQLLLRIGYKTSQKPLKNATKRRKRPCFGRILRGFGSQDYRFPLISRRIQVKITAPTTAIKMLTISPCWPTPPKPR